MESIIVGFTPELLVSLWPGKVWIRTLCRECLELWDRRYKVVLTRGLGDQKFVGKLMGKYALITSMVSRGMYPRTSWGIPGNMVLTPIEEILGEVNTMACRVMYVKGWSTFDNRMELFRRTFTSSYYTTDFGEAWKSIIMEYISEIPDDDWDVSWDLLYFGARTWNSNDTKWIQRPMGVEWVGALRRVFTGSRGSEYDNWWADVMRCVITGSELFIRGEDDSEVAKAVLWAYNRRHTSGRSGKAILSEAVYGLVMGEFKKS